MSASDASSTSERAERRARERQNKEDTEMSYKFYESDAIAFLKFWAAAHCAERDDCNLTELLRPFSQRDSTPDITKLSKFIRETATQGSPSWSTLCHTKNITQDIVRYRKINKASRSALGLRVDEGHDRWIAAWEKVAEDVLAMYMEFAPKELQQTIQNPEHFVVIGAPESTEDSEEERADSPMSSPSHEPSEEDTLLSGEKEEQEEKEEKKDEGPQAAKLSKVYAGTYTPVTILETRREDKLDIRLRKTSMRIVRWRTWNWGEPEETLEDVKRKLDVLLERQEEKKRAKAAKRLADEEKQQEEEAKRIAKEEERKRVEKLEARKKLTLIMSHTATAAVAVLGTSWALGFLGKK